MSARVGALIVLASVRAGATPEELARKSRFDPATADDPDARITLELEERLWTEGERLSGDADLGLHAAELLKPGTFDVFDYAVRTAPTLRLALERAARYNRLTHDSAVYDLTDEGDTLRVEHHFQYGSGRQCRHSAELTLASHVVIGSQITGVRLVPQSVEFVHARPAFVAEHQRLFGVAPRFGAPVNALVWSRADLERPVVTADPELSKVIERHAQALLAQRVRPALTTADRVRRELGALLQHGEASLPAVALRLKLSERTLQRHLAQEGTRFEQLLDDLRRQLALRYLHDRSLGVGQVAYLLGYAEPSPFFRAFRRWTGSSPSEVRRGLRDAAAVSAGGEQR